MNNKSRQKKDIFFLFILYAEASIFTISGYNFHFNHFKKFCHVSEFNIVWYQSLHIISKCVHIWRASEVNSALSQCWIDSDIKLKNNFYDKLGAGGTVETAWACQGCPEDYFPQWYFTVTGKPVFLIRLALVHSGKSTSHHGADGRVQKPHRKSLFPIPSFQSLPLC